MHSLPFHTPYVAIRIALAFTADNLHCLRRASSDLYEDDYFGIQEYVRHPFLGHRLHPTSHDFYPLFKVYNSRNLSLTRINPNLGAFIRSRPPRVNFYCNASPRIRPPSPSLTLRPLILRVSLRCQLICLHRNRKEKRNEVAI